MTLLRSQHIKDLINNLSQTDPRRKGAATTNPPLSEIGCNPSITQFPIHGGLSIIYVE